MSDLGEVLTLQALLSSRAGGDPLKSDSLPNFEMWMCKQSSIVQMLAHDSPRRLATHLLSMHKLKSAFSLAEKPNELPGAHDQTSNMFDIVTRSRLPQAWQQLGILSVILPDAFDIGLDCQIVSNLSVTDIIGITRVLRTTNEHNLAPLSLLGCHLARKKSNKRLAGRFLNDEALQSGLTSWLRALAIVENREMLMSGCSKEDSAKFLVQWWDSTQREIQEVATMDGKISRSCTTQAGSKPLKDVHQMLCMSSPTGCIVLGDSEDVSFGDFLMKYLNDCINVLAGLCQTHHG